MAAVRWWKNEGEIPWTVNETGTDQILEARIGSLHRSCIKRDKPNCRLASEARGTWINRVFMEITSLPKEVKGLLRLDKQGIQVLRYA